MTRANDGFGSEGQTAGGARLEAETTSTRIGESARSTSTRSTRGSGTGPTVATGAAATA